MRITTQTEYTYNIKLTQHEVDELLKELQSHPDITLPPRLRYIEEALLDERKKAGVEVSTPRQELVNSLNEYQQQAKRVYKR